MQSFFLMLLIYVIIYYPNQSIFRFVSGFSYTEKSYLQTLIRPLYGFGFSNYHYENNIRN